MRKSYTATFSLVKGIKPRGIILSNMSFVVVRFHTFGEGYRPEDEGELPRFLERIHGLRRK